jgi:hypothetical protein
MAIWSWLIPTIVSAGASLLGADKAAKASKSATSGARKTADAQVQLFNLLKGLVDESVKSGAFDPDKMMREYRSESDKSLSRSSENLAGTLRTAGYMPGDTPLESRLASNASRYMADLASKSQTSKQDQLYKMLSAYNMVGSSSLGTAANTYQNIASTYQNQANQSYLGLANLLGNVAQYIPQKNNNVPANTSQTQSNNKFFTPISSISSGMDRYAY